VLVRLKTDTTSAGSAKAGHYVGDFRECGSRTSRRDVVSGFSRTVTNEAQ